MERKPGRETDGRGLAIALAIAVHGPILLLLRAGPWLDAPAAWADTDRIRLVWSQRAPDPVPAASPPAVPAGHRQDPAITAAVRELHGPPDPALRDAETYQTLEDDAWVVGPVAMADVADAMNFRRPLFGQGRGAGNAALAAPSHLPGLRMGDASLGGRLQAMAKAYDCGELKMALQGGAGAVVGNSGTPGVRSEIGGDASTDTILATMRRLGCRF